MVGLYVEFLFIFILFIPAKSSEQLEVSATRVRGELDGHSILRCSVLPKTANVIRVDWRAGKMFDLLFIYMADKTDPQGRRGAFRNRTVEGRFNHDKGYHELEIYGSVLQDETTFTCLVMDAWKNVAQGSIFLLLVAPPSVKPEVKADDGTVWATPSPACFVKKVKQMHRRSFTCIAGESRPASKIKWTVSPNVTIWTMNVTLNKTQKHGARYTAVSRKIYISSRNESFVEINCTVHVPHTSSLDMDAITICLRIQTDAHSHSIALIAVENLVILLFTLGWWWISLKDGRFMDSKGGWYLFSTFCATVSLVLQVAAVIALHIIYGHIYQTELENRGKKVDASAFYLAFPLEFVIVACLLLILRLSCNIIAMLYCRSRTNSSSDGDDKKAGKRGVAFIILLGPAMAALSWWKTFRGQNESEGHTIVLWTTTIIQNVVLLLNIILWVVLALSSEECFNVLTTIATCRKSRSEPTVALYLFYGFTLVFYFTFLAVILIYRRTPDKISEKADKSKETLLNTSNGRQ